MAGVAGTANSLDLQGHRGARGLLPENTLPAFAQALTIGVTTLELDTAEGQEIVRALAARSDIVVENFKPGTLEKWGLGWEDLSKLNPRLVMVR